MDVGREVSETWLPPNEASAIQVTPVSIGLSFVHEGVVSPRLERSLANGLTLMESGVTARAQG